jgi:hypothetical protein
MEIAMMKSTPIALMMVALLSIASAPVLAASNAPDPYNTPPLPTGTNPSSPSSDIQGTKGYDGSNMAKPAGSGAKNGIPAATDGANAVSPAESDIDNSGSHNNSKSGGETPKP